MQFRSVRLQADGCRPAEAGRYVCGFLARHSSELPNGQSNQRSQALSRNSAPLITALIGPAGTEISYFASASPDSPRRRCSVRTAAIGKNSVALVYVIRSIVKPPLVTSRPSVSRV